MFSLSSSRISLLEGGKSILRWFQRWRRRGIHSDEGKRGKETNVVEGQRRSLLSPPSSFSTATTFQQLNKCRLTTPHPLTPPDLSSVEHSPSPYLRISSMQGPFILPPSSHVELDERTLTSLPPFSLPSCSDLRQVPDTQEVFLSPDSDLSYIIEILQQVEGDECEAVAKFVQARCFPSSSIFLLVFLFPPQKRSP